eukprot:XP_011617589.1 PREDICTED: complement decay-accelerating factor-like isoform X2 [Takifugu rubripes]
MEGDATMVCSLNGQWTPGIPKCTAVTCSPPPTITSGTFSPQKPLYQYQEMVEYSCDQGFTLSGSKSLSCSLDGTFNGSPPTCSSPPSPIVVVGTLVALTGVGGIVGFLVYWNKRQSSRKDLHGKQGTETEEEVALS